jgi:Tol biopolymer transport system component
LPGCRPGFGGWDIFVSQRAAVNAPWGTPQNLGPVINTPYNESAPSLSVDGHRMYFASDRPGGFGGNDIYVSRRHNKRDDFSWQLPANLGSGVNTIANEAGPEIFEDDDTGVTTLYFDSNRPGGPGPFTDDGNGNGNDIYVSILQPDETFGLPTLVAELSTPFLDRQPAIRRDGLEMFLASNRPGTLGGLDLWVSTRTTTSDPWPTPVNLGSVVNSAAGDAGPALSFKGTTLYFQSVRPGGFGAFDLYMTTRTKLKGVDEN